MHGAIRQTIRIAFRHNHPESACSAAQPQRCMRLRCVASGLLMLDSVKTVWPGRVGGKAFPDGHGLTSSEYPHQSTLPGGIGHICQPPAWIDHTVEGNPA